MGSYQINAEISFVHIISVFLRGFFRDLKRLSPQAPLLFALMILLLNFGRTGCCMYVQVFLGALINLLRVFSKTFQHPKQPDSERNSHSSR